MRVTSLRAAGKAVAAFERLAAIAADLDLVTNSERTWRWHDDLGQAIRLAAGALRMHCPAMTEAPPPVDFTEAKRIIAVLCGARGAELLRNVPLPSGARDMGKAREAIAALRDSETW